MDKNFINIDDLVRQRLSGGEERERSGAWTRMRELLDEEENKKPVGFLYWRRILGAMAVLILLTSVSLGGYKLSTSKAGGPEGPVANLAGLPSKDASAALASSNSKATKPSGSAAVESYDQVKQPVTASSAPPDIHTTTHSTASEYPVASTTNTYADQPNTIQHRTSKSNQTTGDIESKPLSNSSKASKGNRLENLATNTPENSNSKNSLKKNDVSNPNTKEVATNDESENVATSGTNPEPKPGTTRAANNRASHPRKTTVNGTGNTQTVALSGASGTKADPSNQHSILRRTSPATTSTHVLNGQPPVAVNTVPGSGKTIARISSKRGTKTGTGSIALGSHAPKTSIKTVPGAVASRSHTPKTSHLPAIASAGSKTTKTGNTHSTHGAARVHSTVASPTILSGAPVATATPSGSGHGKRGNTGPAATEEGVGQPVASVLAKRDKMAIEKMIICQRHVKLSSDRTHYELDTVSMYPDSMFAKEMAEEYVANEAHTNPLSSARNSGSTTSSANAGTNPQTVLGATPPAATAGKLSASKSSATGKTATTGSVKSMGDDAPTGAQQLANLNQAFNDIKYKVGAAKFAPGLTAGINSTFFGPNSFKGFQFGFAGNFIFGDTWSIMAEIEYFHRINNNYTLDDYYYQNGGTTKQLELTTYTFSTLHSFEMPISARYQVGAFSFFAGLNLDYSMSINLNRDNPPATGSAPSGTENSPKLSVSDFSSRFGLGYLFGFSYNIAPNITLDMRNVQTVWDNSASTGSKYVSDQLYKSPSIQFSIIYRLGGNKLKK